MERLCGDEMPAIVYIPCSRPLADDVDRIRREVMRHGIGYLVVNSVGLACDGPPEAAEVAIRFFGALRELGLGSLLVAHVNRSGDTERPFGSAFWHNGMRLTWYAKLEAGHRRIDHGRPVLQEGQYGPEGRADGLPDRLGRAHRDRPGRTSPTSRTWPPTYPSSPGSSYELRAGAKTIAEVASLLAIPVDTAKKTLSRHEGTVFVRIVGTDGVTRWGNAA